MKAKPIVRAQRVDHLHLVQVELLRAEALLSYLAYGLKYADSEEIDTFGGGSLLAEMAREQVASAVDKLDAAGIEASRPAAIATARKIDSPQKRAAPPKSRGSSRR
jgi:hypothetical protein